MIKTITKIFKKEEKKLVNKKQNNFYQNRTTWNCNCPHHSKRSIEVSLCVLCETERDSILTD